MIRVLKNCGLNLSTVHSSSYSFQRQIKCTLCNRVLNGHRNDVSNEMKYSTDISPIFLESISRKKKYRKKGDFTELLEVGCDQTNEKKAKIKKIGARNVFLLSQTRDSFQRQSEVTKASENILQDDPKEMLEELAEMQEEGAVGQEVLLEAIPVDTKQGQTTMLDAIGPQELITTDAIKAENRLIQKKRKRDPLEKVKMDELEKLRKENSLRSCLVSYLELCNNCGFLNRGWVTLDYYLKSKMTSVETSSKVFEIVMEGFARHGKLDKVLELKQIMESSHIKPTITVFSLLIEAIARSPKHEKIDLLNSALRELSKQGFDLNDIFIFGRWKGDSREVVLSAIKAVRHTFQPSIPEPESHYCCSLLKDFNVENNCGLKSPSEGILNRIELHKLYKQQLAMEREFFVNVKSIENISVTNGSDTRNEEFVGEATHHYRKKLEELKSSWESNVLEALHRDLLTMNARYRNFYKSAKQISLYPYLVVLDKNEYKDIIMHEIRKLAEGSETFSPSVNLLYRNIGNQVKLRYDMKMKCDSGALKKIEKLYNEYCKWYLDPKNGQCNNGRHQWQKLKHIYQHGSSVDIESSPWPYSVLIGIGKFLYTIIMKDIRVDVNLFRAGNKSPHFLPAFYSVYRYHGNLSKEEVKPHPVLSRLYRAASLQYLTFNVSEVPMLAPPIPWTAPASGGYILAKTNIIRLPSYAIQQWERLNETPETQIYPTYDSLNQLASVPWRVNTPVLDVVISVFNSGGNAKLDIPEPPSVFPTPEPITSDMSKIERFQAYKERMVSRRHKAEMYSLWCDSLYKLSLANHFRDKIFWLPHNMDFRGRVYPCPPHLNHLGADMARSLLIFAKGEPLGSKGFDWLKIHLVNLTGLKKRNSINERLEYANEKMPEILDSANNPLDGEKWWVKSEEPWQTFACCLEIRNALSCPNGPENYVSQFPVHQDGSCNGLQHYAALGRDAAGAYSVNLAPSEAPQDVYSCVVALVERERSIDAQAGVKIAQVLEEFVKRKVIKQTVMTTVYGVTRFGARLQIAKQLKDIDNFPKDYVWPASSYLVSKTFSSIREMFTSTREIQDWFTESARYIAQIRGKNVEYVTPLGLPVVQPYTHGAKESKTINEGFNIHTHLDMYERPNVMKQKNAFPPNFIHSLDSCHMMLTSLHCEKVGITFVSVHDCYWTHACSIEKMNRICREQFVALHSQPILQNLSEFLFKKFGFPEEDLKEDSRKTGYKKHLNSLLRQLPSRGDFELEKVIDSIYFFS